MAYRTDFGCIHQRPLAVFAAPGRYVQGPGATLELGRELQRLGLQGPILFIAGGTARRTLAPIWHELLPPVGLQPVVAAFGGECSEAEIKRLRNVAADHRFCAVVGAGGGKASDTARAVADELELPVVITPTLASTDSPCSALSVIYSDEGSVTGFRFYNRHPELLLVDTEVIAKAPKDGVIAVTAVDGVVALTTVDGVVPGTAIDVVITAPAKNNVVAAAARERISTVYAVQRSSAWPRQSNHIIDIICSSQSDITAGRGCDR